MSTQRPWCASAASNSPLSIIVSLSPEEKSHSFQVALSVKSAHATGAICFLVACMSACACSIPGSTAFTTGRSASVRASNVQTVQIWPLRTSQMHPTMSTSCPSVVVSHTPASQAQLAGNPCRNASIGFLRQPCQEYASSPCSSLKAACKRGRTASHNGVSASSTSNSSANMRSAPRFFRGKKRRRLLPPLLPLYNITLEHAIMPTQHFFEEKGKTWPETGLVNIYSFTLLF